VGDAPLPANSAAYRKQNDMAAKKTKPGYDYLVSVLKKNPKAVYAEVATVAKKKGHTVYPIMWGRAKAALGLVKSKPRKKKAKLGKRGPGRPRKNEVLMDGTIEGIVAAVKSSEQAKARYRNALVKIRTILADALD